MPYKKIMQSIVELLGYYLEGLANSFANYSVLEGVPKQLTDEEQAEKTKRAYEIKYWFTLTKIRFLAIKDKLKITSEDEKQLENAIKQIEDANTKNEERKKSVETFITTLSKIYVENLQYENITSANKELNKTGFI